ncbi:PH domain-containing protein [Halobacillus campisalis]|uniref:PH domain-containing protein n=1 Tax=Halobacillus campisalis TaxID=435909 RepID=A0ABW2K713_9BACI|nr:PH domain-containing protein [Halobacillus campisalis]
MFGGIILFILTMYIIGGEPEGWQLIRYNSIPGYIVSGLIIGLLLWIWFRTGYTIEKGKVHISYGPFRKSISIEKIKKLGKTRNPFTAPALSIDRLDILYGDHQTIQVSPKHEAEFIRLLTEENPHTYIEGKNRLKS